MSEKILLSYLRDIFISWEGEGIAFADLDFKILWHNDAFKKTLNEDRIKNRSLTSLITGLESEQLNNLPVTKNFEIVVNDISASLIIQPIKTSGDIVGYLIRVSADAAGKPSVRVDDEIVKNNLDFQSELLKILTLLVKENSPSVIARELLMSSILLSKGDFGLAAINQDGAGIEFLYFDPPKQIKNKPELEKEIQSSASFINKWLLLNKKSLIVRYKPASIGFNLIKELNCETLVLSPCIFDGKLTATIYVAKKSGLFSSLQINNIEQLSILLSFAISSIRTRELNSALEGRLLQAQKLETIGKLSSGMAHDFNNLLASIFGSLNLLKSRVPENESVSRLIENIESCSIRAKDLTTGLLSFGKPIPKRKELVQPNRLLNELSKVISQTFPKAITFQTEFSPKLYDIIGNGTEIYQILLNLCVNAKEAISGKGTVTLSADNIIIDESNVFLYPLYKPGKYVCFSVKDTGSGIKEEDIPRIFDPYFSTKQKETGSGLGLYVTYGIIKAHSGYVDVTSTLNQGTTFKVYLPSFEPNKAREEKAGEKIILLADDEIMLRDLLAELLESNGYAVVKVTTGEEAVKVLKEEIKVDLAIIDYNMPRMNGLDCAIEIRKFNEEMPIILSSGSMYIDENFDLKKYKINSKLLKPYEFETMLATIRKLI
jgi:signal transduction histidine kinase/CheY-like chemotaxis protein